MSLPTLAFCGAEIRNVLDKHIQSQTHTKRGMARQRQTTTQTDFVAHSHPIRSMQHHCTTRLVLPRPAPWSRATVATLGLEIVTNKGRKETRKCTENDENAPSVGIVGIEPEKRRGWDKKRPQKFGRHAGILLSFVTIWMFLEHQLKVLQG